MDTKEHTGLTFVFFVSFVFSIVLSAPLAHAQGIAAAEQKQLSHLQSLRLQCPQRRKLKALQKNQQDRTMATTLSKT